MNSSPFQWRPAEFDAAIVDLDGTMVDTLGDFCVALNRMLGDLPPPLHQYQVEHGTVERLVGKGSENLIKNVLLLAVVGLSAINMVVDGQGVEASNATVERLYPQAWSSYQRHYLAVNGQHAQVYPGVLAGLRALKAQGLRLACLTNKPTEFALTLLKVKGLDGFFDVTFGGDAFERKKPDPLPLLKTCAALACAPQRTLMIGDSSNDAQAARAAGCRVLLVTYGYNHGQPIRAVDADGYTDSLQSLALRAPPT